MLQRRGPVPLAGLEQALGKSSVWSHFMLRAAFSF
jgi:hypothetical protein